MYSRLRRPPEFRFWSFLRPCANPNVQMMRMNSNRILFFWSSSIRHLPSASNIAPIHYGSERIPRDGWVRLTCYIIPQSETIEKRKSYVTSNHINIFIFSTHTKSIQNAGCTSYHRHTYISGTREVFSTWRRQKHQIIKWTMGQFEPRAAAFPALHRLLFSMVS